jgi:hypothetical protein
MAPNMVGSRHSPRTTTLSFVATWFLIAALRVVVRGPLGCRERVLVRLRATLCQLAAR